MNFRKHFFILIVFGVLSSAFAVTTPQTNGNNYATLLDQYAQSDSVACLRDSLANVASMSYKEYKQQVSIGELPDDYFPTLYLAYENALNALNVMNSGSTQYITVKGILRDIDPELERGAYFYSGKGDSGQMTKFARAYVDIQLLDDFADEKFNNNPDSFPTIVYIAASGAYNAKEYDKAIDYFKTYFATGEPDKREQVYIFMGQACLNTGRYELALSTMSEGIKIYPANRHIAMIGITSAIEAGRSEYLQPFLDTALAMTPDDVNLLNVQGKLYEDLNDFKKALYTFERVDQLEPNTLSTARHIGLCYYNLAVVEFNRSVNEPNEKEARKSRTRARNYFNAAANKLEEVLAADPTSTKYMRAIATCYLCLEDKAHFDSYNARLQALGEDALSEVFMPGIMTTNDNNSSNYEGKGVAQLTDIPDFSEFGKEYIVTELHKFMQKGEFERTQDYLARVNDKTIGEQYLRLNQEAADKYMETYGKSLRLSDLKLLPYDANNETFLIETSYGPISLNVPAADQRAQLFKRDWAAVKVRAPRYFIEDNKVKIAQLSFVTPDGNTYTYDNTNARSYSPPVIEIDVNDILSQYAQNDADGAKSSGQGARVKITRKSDVDENIPVTNAKNQNTFALIIANENYTKGLNQVQSAIHDGEVFRQYCQSTLGILPENIIFECDATLGTIIGSLDRLKRIVAPYHGDASIIFYYAGHGSPDEATREAYILPVDGSATVSTANFALNKLYDSLASIEARGVVAFIDACFSGSSRGEGMLLDARSVAFKPKEATPKGKMFILTASSGQESAMPYTEKNHGLFTYFLLKKLQESKGNVTLRDLSDYVIDNVSKNANRINNKPQTPTLTTSGMSPDEWGKQKLRK